jgi:hypothetical protein
LSLFSGEWEICYVFISSPSAAFQISDLRITSTEVHVGEEVFQLR